MNTIILHGKDVRNILQKIKPQQFLRRQPSLTRRSTFLSPGFHNYDLFHSSEWEDDWSTRRYAWENKMYLVHYTILKRFFLPIETLLQLRHNEFRRRSLQIQILGSDIGLHPTNSPTTTVVVQIEISFLEWNRHTWLWWFGLSSRAIGFCVVHL